MNRTNRVLNVLVILVLVVSFSFSAPASKARGKNKSGKAVSAKKGKQATKRKVEKARRKAIKSSPRKQNKGIKKAPVLSKMAEVNKQPKAMDYRINVPALSTSTGAPTLVKMDTEKGDFIPSGNDPQEIVAPLAKPTADELKALAKAQVDDEEEGDEAVDPADQTRMEKLRDANSRADSAGLPYAKTFQALSKAGMQRVSPGSSMTFLPAVMSEKSCKLVKRKVQVTKKGKKGKRIAVKGRSRWVWRPVCHSVPRPRNYVQPYGAEFLRLSTEKLKPLNGGKIPVSSLARDEGKQVSLTRAGYPTAPVDPETGKFLSQHLRFNAVDFSKRLRPEAKAFIRDRFITPFENIRIKFRPVNVYFEGGRGSIHVEFPVNAQQLALCKRLLEATTLEEINAIVQEDRMLSSQNPKRTGTK